MVSKAIVSFSENCLSPDRKILWLIALALVLTMLSLCLKLAFFINALIKLGVV